MPTLNYTTTIASVKTIGEIQTMLVKHGADAVAIRYEGQEPCGLSFQLPTPHGDRGFTLPVDIDAVWKVLVGQRKRGEIRSDRLATREQAARVGWRVVKDWLAAQLAIIEAQMATLDQVMLPYLHADGDRTLYEVYREREQKALLAGSED